MSDRDTRPDNQQAWTDGKLTPSQVADLVAGDEEPAEESAYQAIMQAVRDSGITEAPQVVEVRDARPALILVELPDRITFDVQERIIRSLTQTLKDKASPLADLPVAVLSGGARLTVLDAQGRALNRRLNDERDAGTPS